MLKKLLSSIVKAAITAGERQLNKITNALLKQLVLLFIGTGEKILLALLDDDKNNEKQLLQVVKESTAQIISVGSNLGRDKLNAFKDAKLATAIGQYLNGTEEVLKALVDDNQDNEGQIREIWQRRKLAILGDSLDVVTDQLATAIRKKIKDPIMANVIIELLQSLDDLVKSPEPTS